MRGTNPKRPQTIGDGTSLWVQEIFYTLQGEGPFTGHPAVFVRLGGCNLSCLWCDTDFESSDWTPSTNEIIAKINELAPPQCKLVVITGGEPFRQNIVPLTKSLLEQNYQVQIETNGTLWLDLPKHENLFIVCSPKTEKLHPKMLEIIDSYKYVLESGKFCVEDGLPTYSTQIDNKELRIARPEPNTDDWVMPLDSGSEEKNLANQRDCVEVSKNFNYKLTLQTHKLLGIK